ncbi:MAG: hypothetical protein CM15mP127_14790 [Gammaproteobacteria bacterium]|nr:MAG: hypothetical protein CM15mP127_14790 [Gammaproteobacteria bacterium]
MVKTMKYLQLLREPVKVLEDVGSQQLIEEIRNASYDGMSEKDLADCMVISARTMVEKEPNYSYVTARILLNNIEKKCWIFWKLIEN